ncbi:hypothetical protein NUM3379_00330 [Kineococcus sp. NUM-3379]
MPGARRAVAAHVLAALSCAVFVLAGAAPGSAAPPGPAEQVPAGAPRADFLRCGDVLLRSVRLAADLTCPAGRGIVVAADGVDVNLNGHTLTGPGAGEAGTPAPHVGLDVRGRGVTVRNGTVAAWGYGVRVGADSGDGGGEPPTGAVLRGLRLQENRWGTLAGAGAAVTVEDSWLVGNTLAGATVWGGRLLVQRTTADRNFIGLLVMGTDPVDGGFVLRDSVVRRSTEAGVDCSSPVARILIERTTLQRNFRGYDDHHCGWWTVRNSAFLWNSWHVGGEVDTRTPRYTLECVRFIPRDRLGDIPVPPCP